MFLTHINGEQSDINQVITIFTKNLNKKIREESIKNIAKNILDKNQNFDWYQKHPSISKTNRKLLDNIYVNRFRGEYHFYVPKEGYVSEIPNEKSYNFSKDENLPLNYRLLTLAKIIGSIDYLYPHKYLMSNDAEQTLERLVDECSRTETRKDFEMLLAKAVSTLEDTHAFRFYNQLNYRKDIFHTSHYAPFDFIVRENYVLVTQIIFPELCKNANINVGDRITAIDGKKVEEIIQEKNKLLSTSNHETLLHRLSDYQNNLIWPNSNEIKVLTVQKQGNFNSFESSIPFISSDDKSSMTSILKYLKTKQENKKQTKLTEPNVAYFRIDQTFSFIEDIEDDKINSEMEKILSEASSKKAIVFDMRGYPDWGGFVYTYIYSYFSDKTNYFGKYYQQNLNNIGTFQYNENSETYFPKDKLYNAKKYNGKVFIIVNQETLSASEWNAMNLQHIFPQAITIGQQTAGADGDIKKLILPGNYILEFTGNGIFYPNGEQTQKKGIKINHKIEYNDIDIVNNTDKIFTIIKSTM